MSISISDLCEQHQMKPVDLAKRSGLDTQRGLAIVVGRWTPSPKERKQIASVFDRSIDDIAWGHKTPIQHIYGQGPS